MNSFSEIIVTKRISDFACSGPLSEVYKSSLTPSTGDFASLFLFLSSYVGSGVDGFISNISLGSSYGWYFRVDQFELIFLSLLMLQLFILRYIEILPINMNNLFLGDPSGRRRKRDLNFKFHKLCRRDELAESMLKLLRKLDDGECFPFALCEMGKLLKSGKHIPDDFHIPRETEKLITALKLSGDYRKKYAKECESNTALKFFEDAVALGDSGIFLNETICENRYHACPLSSQDVIHHVRTISEADMLS